MGMIDMSEGEADYFKYRFKQYLGSVSREIQNRRLKEQVEMTKEEIIADERYHTCGRCRWGDLPEDFYPCNKCIHGVDRREDFWQYAECEVIEDGNEL